MSNTSSPIKIEALSRFSSLPLVNSAIGLATDGYSRFKSYNKLLSATLSKAEQSILFMASTAKPIVQKLEKPISYADNIACQGLDKLEEKVPALKKSTDEIRDETKKLFEGSVGRIEGVRKYSTDTLHVIKDYGFTKVNGILDSPYIRVFVKSIDTAIDLTHNAVDHYLPAAPNEKPTDKSEGQTLVVRMSHLSDKMRRRMYDQLTTRWIPNVLFTANSFKLNVLNWVHHNGISSQQSTQWTDSSMHSITDFSIYYTLY